MPLSPSSPVRRRLLRTALAGAAACALPAFAQGTPPVLRLGYIGPAKKPATATGWALREGHLLRELAPLGIREIATRNFPNGRTSTRPFSPARSTSASTATRRRWWRDRAAWMRG
ncbi:hypothetical protein [Variovorax sp. JS1663]|uniref:hypothetical protein n=1 Tax=Variovorax sp. JS1663 TaxID=1851577 RepID=UPI001EDEC154|nr:hypothetical protein [Variovorax sp. JS1663]